MKIYNRIKRTTKQYIIVAFICIVVIGGAAIFTAFIITKQVKEEYQALLSDAYYDMEMNKKSVYVASVDIITGEAVTKDNVKKMTVYSSQPLENYITEEGIGKLALIDIPANTQVLTTMMTDNTISSELREMEYEVININSNIISNDTVDVRIFFPNGESYIILSKKAIKGLTMDTLTCYLWLDEEELLRMSAAIVDASLYPGAKLFITKYIEPNIQTASIVNYTPSIAILDLLEKDPNILERASQELSIEARKALENRLASSMDTDVATISWDINPNVNKNIVPTDSPVLGTKTGDTTGESDAILEEVKEAEPESTTKAIDYFYYTEEDKAKDGELEYGE